ncbi:hypothetical protein [Actinomadura litoris]|uniref:Uncharacterized protein n=1 Tax=Actinomadura litoris TaxID=2678616 RepID=A0A7K1LAK9_9ACTN|nr:hypothetical protein [Actinomadura litoris]MUN41459.1 hypothetical protein [Actinomadura litoris]
MPTNTNPRPDNEQPTPEQLATAIRTLQSAWDGAWTPTPTGPVDDPDECDCAGEYDDGTPRCNCGDACTCANCNLLAVQRMATCQGVAGCGRPTRYRVSAWSVRPNYARPDDADPSPRDEHGYVQVGNTVQRTWSLSACGSVCARAVIDRHAHMGAHIHFEVERWTYQPDLAELPRALGVAVGCTGAAHRALKQLAVDVYRGGGRASRLWSMAARRELAGAAAAMADVPEPADGPELLVVRRALV